MKKKEIKKKVPTVKQLKEVLATSIRDLFYLQHRNVSLIRRMSRGEKIEDGEFALMHNDIDLIGRNYYK